MVATTFAADTPLVVTGLIASGGLAGNWVWWCVGIAHVVAALVFARLWRRLEVVTDAQITAVRYSGVWAQRLRAITAGYQALLINCLVMGWILVAMRKLSLALFPDSSPYIITGGLLGLSVFYSTLGGMHAVVLTDLIQFSLAMLGAVALAWFALDDMGGFSGLKTRLDTLYPEQVDSILSLTPTGDLPGLPLTLFAVLLTVGWWKNAQGAGYIVQRLSACKSPEEAEKASLFFAIVHNALRPWPWIVVGLVALVVWPLDGGACVEGIRHCGEGYQCVEGACTIQDREATYPWMMTKYLPPGWLGIVVASMLAAFMSTMDTHLNWGSSYLVHDFRLFSKDDGESPLWVGRAGSWVLAGLAFTCSLAMDSIVEVWLLLIMLGGGMGSVWLGRWIWWRVSARVELVAMASATLLAAITLVVQAPSLLGTSNPLYLGDIPKSVEMLFVIVGTLFLWILAALRFSPEPSETLTYFYRQVHPPRLGWRPIAADIPNHGVHAAKHRLVLRVALGLTAVYGTLWGMASGLIAGEGGLAVVGIGAGLGSWIFLARTAGEDVAPLGTEPPIREGERT